LLVFLKSSMHLINARNTEHTKQKHFVVKCRFLVLQTVVNTVTISLRQANPFALLFSSSDTTSKPYALFSELLYPFAPRAQFYCFLNLPFFFQRARKFVTSKNTQFEFTQHRYNDKSTWLVPKG